jgi:hypothetical protein
MPYLATNLSSFRPRICKAIPWGVSTTQVDYSNRQELCIPPLQKPWRICSSTKTEAKIRIIKRFIQPRENATEAKDKLDKTLFVDIPLRLGQCRGWMCRYRCCYP